MTQVLANYQRFISAELASLEPDGPPEIVVLSFGGENTPVLQYGLHLDDIRDLVAGCVTCLAQAGDEKAKQIGDTFFT